MFEHLRQLGVDLVAILHSCVRVKGIGFRVRVYLHLRIRQSCVLRVAFIMCYVIMCATR